MNLEHIERLDRNDPLAAKRAEFHIPENTIYLNGNSLGALPIAAQQHAKNLVEEEWGNGLVRSWNRHDWINLPGRVGDKIAALIGADVGQVICCDSTSVNLYKVLHCALHMQSGRHVVLTEQDNFPADLYVAQGLAASIQDREVMVKAVPRSELGLHLNEDVAVLLLTHVQYRTAAVHNMAELTRAAHAHGVLVVWDLAHSAGAVPLTVDADRVDFAVGCGYKYLNGGPGAPAFVYAAQRHHNKLRLPLTGWMGHRAPFEFAAAYTPASGVRQFLCGTPPIISMSMLSAALTVYEHIDMTQLRAKSISLSELFLQLCSENEALQSLQLQSPVAAELRGSHLAFSHTHAYELAQAMIKKGVIVDFRAPTTLRIGFAPLYLTYKNVWDSAHILADILEGEDYLPTADGKRNQVT